MATYPLEDEMLLKIRKVRPMLFSIDMLGKYKAKFEKIFGRKLHDFYTFPCGFDVVGFDEWLEVPMDGNTSTRSFIEDHYGEEAAEMVEALL